MQINVHQEVQITAEFYISAAILEKVPAEPGFWWENYETFFDMFLGHVETHGT